MGSRASSRCARVGAAAVLAGTLLLASAAGPTALAAKRHHKLRAAAGRGHDVRSGRTPTATPIKHLVVVFQENRSFDRYFGTYPYALNPPGEPRFVPAPGTPSVNGLTPALLTHNPNSANPVRLGPDVGNTCGSNHQYLAEQKAYDQGLVDRFVEEDGPTAPGCDPTKVMDYYDGNTVTALWNYAQHFSLNDNSFGTTFGPSHVRAINLVSGNNHGLFSANRAARSSAGPRSATSSRPTMTVQRTRSTSTSPAGTSAIC